MKLNKLRLIPALVIFLFLSACNNTPTQFESHADRVAEILNKTNIDSLTLSVKKLSGELSVTLAGSSYQITSRHRDNPGNDIAADYLEGKLESFGLEAENDYFDQQGRNVYAVQQGAEFPNQVYMICAHYDSYSQNELAPGADDNASGSAAVLEAARIFSQYTMDYTIIYAFWDEEEQGLRGSRHYAAEARDNHASILGVINLDMIGWDSDNDDAVLISENDFPASLQLTEQAIKVNVENQIGLSFEITNQLGRSDHVAFWEQGYGAILIIEYFGTDFNRYYHSADDKISYFNLDYFHKCARLAIGTLAALAIRQPNQSLDMWTLGRN